MSIFRLGALALLLALLPASGRAATFLFDATKAESAGNANWVLDEDNNVAARYPTPAASGITASTSETYWTGALSSWGVALVQLGHSVEQLPVGGRITYLDSTNAQDLSKYQVYVVCEPNILFTTAEKTALARYVQDGGSLFVISDHTGSDRNNDGYDSVAIWNDFFSYNGVQANPFGVTINYTSVTLTSTYADTAADDILTNGALGAVTQLKYSAGATLTLDPTANRSVRAAFWSGATHTNSNVMAAYGTFGAGRFAVLCDSSPVDDGTGSPGHTLYPGWTELGVNHSRLALNASLWLASGVVVPPNDNFANATPLDLAAIYVPGYNIGATREAGEPSHADVTGYNSVWWQFTAPNSGTATLDTGGSKFDTLLAVYTGASVNALTKVAANDNYGSVLQSFVTFPVAAGTTYRVAVDGKTGATGQILLYPKLPAPVNDNFANATVVNYSGTPVTLTGNNYSATYETNEPYHANVGGSSVWWRWTAPANAAVTVSTLGSDFDTALGVYTGSTVDALTLVANNDNYGTSRQSQLSFNAVAGTTYRIAVVGSGDPRGNIVLTLSPSGGANPPTNDNFANATTLTGTSASGSAVNTNATTETGEPNPSNYGHTVWWRWTAPSNLYVTLSTTGSSFTPTLAVYTGTAINALTAVGSASNSSLSFQALSGVTYSIQASSNGLSSGTVALNLASQTLPTVSLAASPVQISEKGSTVGTFTVTFDAPVASAVNVNVLLNGTADTLDDYTSNPASVLGRVVVTVPANQASAPLTITPTPDNYPTEGTESIIATVLTGSNYQVSGQAASATILLLDDSPYNSTWISLYHFTNYAPTITLSAADPDGDGLPNLLEFAFNGNPLVPDAASLLPVVGSGVFTDATGASVRYPTLTFVRRTDAPNLSYTVQTTDDLTAGGWTAANAVFVSASATGMPANTERVVYRSTRALDAGGKQFLRVQVSSSN